MALSDIQKDKILLIALKIAPETGWNDDLIDQAVHKAGLKPAASLQAFPGGILDLQDYFADWGVRQMEQKIQTKRLIHMKIRDRIALSVQTWLDIMTPYKNALRQALKLAWQPRHGLLSLKHLAKLADAIWHQCGDTSTDFNYYTKRTLLSGVIVSTSLFWLKDNSKNHEQTREFLANRIENVLSFGKKINELKAASHTLFKTAQFVKARAR